MVSVHRADRFCLIIIPLLIFLMVAGCATLDVVPAEKLNKNQLTADAIPVVHLHAKNWGWYLFKFIPMVTGNLKKPGCLPAYPTIRLLLLSHSQR